MTRKTIGFSNAYSLNGFFYENKGRVLEKLSSFIDSGKDKLHLVLDFDRTVTVSQNQFGENVTTWELLANHLSVKAQSEYQKFYETYRSLEVAGKLNPNGAIVWWEAILGLFKREGLSWSEIEKITRREMPARAHVKELFNLCRKKRIPTVLISAGIRDVINIWCEQYGIKPTKVLSTKLLFSDTGFIKGWSRKSLIHALNKREKGHGELTKIKLKRPNTILIGDSTDDALMVDGEENVIRIMIHDPRKDAAEEPDRKLLQKFDLLIKDGTLFPVVKLIKQF